MLGGREGNASVPRLAFDPNAEPELHRLVLDYLIHTPCVGFSSTAPCLRDGKCTRCFPKARRENTDDDEHGYPLYRRRCKVHSELRTGVVVDDTWVVPYE